MSEMITIEDTQGDLCNVEVRREYVKIFFSDPTMVFTASQAYDLGRAIEMARREIEKNRIAADKSQLLLDRDRCEEIERMKCAAMLK